MGKKGAIDLADLLANMDEQIAKAKEEASSRKAILGGVKKWMLAREEERWLEEYNRVTSQSHMPPSTTIM